MAYQNKAYSFGILGNGGNAYNSMQIGAPSMYGTSAQQQGGNYVSQLANANANLQSQANRQIENRQKLSEKMFSGMVNDYQKDPMFGYLRSSIINWMKNPGLSQSTMRRLQAQAQARAAAELASGTHAAESSNAMLGLRGAQVEDAKLAARSRSKRGLNDAFLNIDLQNEQMKQQGRAGATSSGQSLMSNYYGGLGNIRNAYTNLLTSYNPQVAPLNVYDAMQQIYANPDFGDSYNPYAGMF